MNQHKKAPARRKPSFSVPEEVVSASQAGWVYRTDAPAPAAAAAPAPSAPPAQGVSLMDTASGAMAVSMAAMEMTFLLGVQAARWPIGWGLRVIKAVGR